MWCSLTPSRADCFQPIASGAEIWRGVARGHDLEAIAAAIVDGYGIAHATALADSARFLAELESHGLVAERSTR